VLLEVLDLRIGHDGINHVAQLLAIQRRQVEALDIAVPVISPAFCLTAKSRQAA